MTIDEMNDAIQDYCKQIEYEGGECGYCVLEPLCSPILGEFKENADACKEAYDIIKNFSKKAPDIVNHPSHYNQGKFECIDVMVDTFGNEATQDFCILNAFKYIWRSKKKGGISDLEKALWYLKKYLELEGASDDKA